ncbi:MAG: ATP-binding protein [Fimbriimonadaceae bacterium]
MKIALTGSHGTGKTTLIRFLGEQLQLPPSAMCREVPRVIIEKVQDDTFFRRGNNTPLRQMLLFFYQVMEEQNLQQGADLVLSDRTVVDHLAYTGVLFPEFKRTEEYRAAMEGVHNWLPSYDAIFKIPIEFPVLDDGVREGEAAFQAEIDGAIDGLYHDAGIETIRVGGSVRERADLIFGYLKRSGAI